MYFRMIDDDACFDRDRMYGDGTVQLGLGARMEKCCVC